MEALYKHYTNGILKKEKGFTIIESLACLMLVFSLMGIVTVKIIENRKTYKSMLIKSYVCASYVKISEIFFNEHNDFISDLNTFFEVDGNKIILEIDKEKIEIDFKYSENYDKNEKYDFLVKTYQLDLIFPEKLQNISYHLFSPKNLMRWHYVE